MRLKEPKELLKRMLEVYSPSGKEEEMASFLRGELTELGFKNVRLDEVGNVFGEVGSGSPTVLLCGHMDTVPGRLPVKVEEGRIYGRGAVDAKASLAAMVVSASRLVGLGDRGRVLVAGVVDEEGEGKGVRHMLRERLDVDYAVFGEPSGVKNVTLGYRGRLWVKIICETEPGHAGAPDLFENAIERAYGLWVRVKEWSLRRRPSRSLFYSTSVSLTRIRGGEATNVIPGRCILDIDVRLPPSVNCQEVIDQLRTVLQQYEEENPKVNLEMRVEDRVEPFLADRGSPLAEALEEAIEETVGGPVRFLRKTGTGDMNVFAAKMGIPVVTYGPGDSRLSHTPNEYIEIDEYQASIEVYRKAVTKILDVEKTIP